ncbi:MAG: VWA domain-containing protein [Kiritimatiellia bacterium]
MSYGKKNSSARSGSFRTAAALSACAVSFVIHVLVLTVASRYAIRLSSAEPLSESVINRSGLRIKDLKREAFSMRPGGKVTRPGESPSVMELTEEVRKLGTPPSESDLEPPAFDNGDTAGEMKRGPESDASVTPGAWEPREEIISVSREAAGSEIRGLERRVIPDIERRTGAPDITAPVESSDLIKMQGRGSGREDFSGKGGLDVKVTVRRRLRDMPSDGKGGKGPEPGRPEDVEGTGRVKDLKPVEDVLKAEITVYSRFFDFDYGYFKVEIERKGEKVLPVLSRDVLLVQDCSNSMAERRLHFCREGLKNCLAMLGEGDRFNVVGFRDSPEMCFKDWARPVPASLGKAKDFIDSLQAGGNTDIFESMKALLKLQRKPGRPVTALLITDGRPTAGVVHSSEIIGEFSKLNKGEISVFTAGTVQTANSYLLDLLSYCNRGDSRIISRGRWSIPDVIKEMCAGIRRPVITDLDFVFASDTGCEVYPVLCSNLYLDRPLVLYGRYPKGLEKVTFQAAGRAGELECDMVFDLPLTGNVERGNKRIKTEWARRKIYHLTGEYARKPDVRILRAMEKTAESYGIRIPYREEM